MITSTTIFAIVILILCTWYLSLRVQGIIERIQKDLEEIKENLKKYVKEN